jgi:MoaA/NifB/PqqE/SkfB family radical SAM enzyme
MNITSRIDNITKMPKEYCTAVLPAPKSCKIEITGRCNYKCAFCAHINVARRHGEMDRNLFNRIIVELKNEGVQEVGLFFLGEPFMCKWLEEAIKYTKDAGISYVFLTTNGSLASPSRLEKCFRAGLDSLKFSLNFCDEAQFAELTGAPSSLFNVVLQNVKAAKLIRDRVKEGTKHHCGLYASFIEYDGEQKIRMQTIIDEVEPFLDEIYALPLYNQTGFSEDKNKQTVHGNRGRIDNMRKPLPCWSVFTEGHITYEGKLSVCYFDHEPGFVMGDLNETSFMEAWNCSEFQSLRQSHLAEDVSGTICEKCVLYQ